MTLTETSPKSLRMTKSRTNAQAPLGIDTDEVEPDIEIRCDGGALLGILRTMHGKRCIETKCHHIRCTQGGAVSVFHYHSLETGALVDTVIYKNAPGRTKR
jgi:hypothetical protein